MKVVERQVSVRELYDILKEKTKKDVSRDDFIFQLSQSWILSPTLELRFHDIDEQREIDTTYVLKYSEIAKSIFKVKANPEDRL